MSLQRSVVRTKLKASLLDAANVFVTSEGQPDIAAFDRHLDAACTDLIRVKPRIVSGTLTLVAGTALYAAPADAVAFHTADAVEINSQREPYESGWIPVVPRGALNVTAASRYWRLSPVPDYRIIAAIGASYGYTYRARHTLSETPADSTIPDEQEPLLLLRAQVEALTEVAIRNAHKPVQTRDSLYSQTRNGTPAAIAELLMRLFEQQTRDSSELFGAGGPA